MLFLKRALDLREAKQVCVLLLLAFSQLDRKRKLRTGCSGNVCSVFAVWSGGLRMLLTSPWGVAGGGKHSGESGLNGMKHQESVVAWLCSL